MIKMEFKNSKTVQAMYDKSTGRYCMSGLCFDTPALISICSEGKWHKAGKAVWLEGNKIYLETGCASWVKIDWSANFSADSYVMGDA